MIESQVHWAATCNADAGAWLACVVHVEGGVRPVQPIAPRDAVFLARLVDGGAPAAWIGLVRDVLAYAAREGPRARSLRLGAMILRGTVGRTGVLIGPRMRDSLLEEVLAYLTAELGERADDAAFVAAWAAPDDGRPDRLVRIAVVPRGTGPDWPSPFATPPAPYPWLLFLPDDWASAPRPEPFTIDLPLLAGTERAE